MILLIKKQTAIKLFMANQKSTKVFLINIAVYDMVHFNSRLTLTYLSLASTQNFSLLMSLLQAHKYAS